MTPRISCCHRFSDGGLVRGMAMDNCVLPFFRALDASFGYGSAMDRK
jgi:hypothetical protein